MESSVVGSGRGSKHSNHGPDLVRSGSRQRFALYMRDAARRERARLVAYTIPS